MAEKVTGSDEDGVQNTLEESGLRGAGNEEIGERIIGEIKQLFNLFGTFFNVDQYKEAALEVAEKSIAALKKELLDKEQSVKALELKIQEVEANAMQRNEGLLAKFRAEKEKLNKEIFALKNEIQAKDQTIGKLKVLRRIREYKFVEKEKQTAEGKSVVTKVLQGPDEGEHSKRQEKDKRLLEQERNSLKDRLRESEAKIARLTEELKKQKKANEEEKLRARTEIDHLKEKLQEAKIENSNIKRL